MGAYVSGRVRICVCACACMCMCARVIRFIYERERVYELVSRVRACARVL